MVTLLEIASTLQWKNLHITAWATSNLVESKGRELLREDRSAPTTSSSDVSEREREHVGGKVELLGWGARPRTEQN